jgi:hypothetical protein
MSSDYIHRVLARSENDAREAVRRLHLKGYTDAMISGSGPRYGYAVDFWSPLRDLDLDFLRPDILPPRSSTAEDTADTDLFPQKETKCTTRTGA